MSYCDSFFTETVKISDNENRLKVRKINFIFSRVSNMSSHDMEIITNEPARSHLLEITD